MKIPRSNRRTLDVNQMESSEGNVSKASEPGQLLQNLCAICHAEPPKYKCPACLMSTCSAVCSKRHKEQTSCTGVVDPTRYIKRSELLSDVHSLNRDYNFLQRVDRQIHVAVNELEDKMPRPKKRGLGMAQNNGNKRRNISETRKVIVRNGVNIHQLPDGMSRATNNRTGWMGKKNKFFGWTIEWVLWEEGTKSEKLSHGIAESAILAEAGTRSLAQKTAETSYCFYLQKVPAPANRPGLIELDGAKTLHDNLQARYVIEFPTIHVVPSGQSLPLGYTLVDADDSSDSESESASSDSSDDSESDSSGGSSDSDSDGSAPEETSSKQTVESEPTPPRVKEEPNQSASQVGLSEEPQPLKDQI